MSEWLSGIRNWVTGSSETDYYADIAEQYQREGEQVPELYGDQVRAGMEERRTGRGVSRRSITGTVITISGGVAVGVGITYVACRLAKVVLAKLAESNRA